MPLEQLQEIFTKHRHDGIDGSQKIRKQFLITTQLVGALPATATNYEIFFINTHTKALKVVAISEVHRVAGSDAGAVTLQIERLQGTEALDAGDPLLVAGFNLKGTANTVVRKGLADLTATKTLLILSQGDRLALDDAGTLADVAGLTVTVLVEEI